MNIADIIGRAAQWLTTKPPAPDLVIAGRDAIEAATEMWQFDVFDSKRSDDSNAARRSKSMIDSFIRRGLGWTWEPTYAGDGSFEWCGAFAAYCWLAVKPELRKTYFASTYRLDRFARYGSVNGEKNKGLGRSLAELDETSHNLPFTPRAGDILTIGPTGSGFGKHICLVESFDGGAFRTLEGNGVGRGPDGKLRQGVVRGTRYLGVHQPHGWHARRLIRPSAEDLA